MKVFLSSTCYDLRDLRATLKSFFKELGMDPLLSEDSNFPCSSDGIEPYLACLKLLEKSDLVIFIIDSRYGNKLDNWSSYQEYCGLSATHAEFKHALKENKPVLVFIQQDIMAAYGQWRKNKEEYSKMNLEHGLSIDTLKFVEEIKMGKPALWVTQYQNVLDIIESLKSRLIGYLYDLFSERKKRNDDEVKYLLDQILSLTPELRKKIEAQINPNLTEEISNLNDEKERLEKSFEEQKNLSLQKESYFNDEKQKLVSIISKKEEELNSSKIALFRSLTKDISWLKLVRSNLVDKQKGRVPFHNAKEVALRGYRPENLANAIPLLELVTWSKLSSTENKLHRGYRAGLVFKGINFAPGCTITKRLIGGKIELEDHKYKWKLPNIYFGDYLEISTNNDEYETPLSYINHEFCIKNPEGAISEWVKFSYPFDFEKLNQILEQNLMIGTDFFNSGRFKDAIEPLRKAMVFSDRMHGTNSEKTIKLRKLWNNSIDSKSLSEMRFKVGDELYVNSGENKGEKVVIIKLYLRNASKRYYVNGINKDFKTFYADNELEKR